MLARSLVMLVVAATVAHAAELPDSVPVSKCRAHKKVLAFFDDGSNATPRTIKMSSAFYLQVGSVAVHACKTFKGSDQCRESFDLGFLLPPGFVGELPCTSVFFLNYGVTSEDGGQSEFWTNTTNCTLTIVKNAKGRLKGTYRAELTGGAGPELAAGEIVGCFSAKQQNLAGTQ